MDDKYNNRLIYIILDNIDYAEYKLKNDEKKWIYKFINESHETFIELDIDFQTITEDAHINLDDIPTIIKIIADTYFGTCKNDVTFNSNNLYVFIKYTIMVVLDSELLILPIHISKERLDNIIDSSMALLNMNLSINSKKFNKIYNENENEKKKISNCFKYVFNYKTI
jgi:hypothetical protein